MSSMYVAELLKQLEDLKKKKAHKEKKLMKLKALKSIKKDKSSDKPVTISSKKILDSSIESNPGLKDDNGNSQCSLNKQFSQNNSPLEGASVHPHLYAKYSKSDCSKKSGDKENVVYKKPDLLLFEDHKLKNNIKISPEVENESHKLNENVNSSRENADHSSTETNKDIEQKLIKFGTSTAEISSTKFSIDLPSTKTGENIKQMPASFETVPIADTPIAENTSLCSLKPGKIIEKKVEMVPAAESLIKVDCASSSFISELSPNKSLILPKSRSKSPDLLDDSFDCNMSILMSSEEQVSKVIDNPVVIFSDNDQAKAINNNVCEFLNNTENAKETEINVDLISSDLKISPPFSLNPSLPESQVSCGIFNFPKFSTPSEIHLSQCDTDKNKFSHLQDKCETQTSPFNVFDDASKLLKNDDLHTAKNCNGTQYTPQCAVQTNKVISSQLNCILGSGLSSVLDAHYGSPNKNVGDKSFSNFNHDDDNRNSIDVTIESVPKKIKLNLNDSADSTDKLAHPNILTFPSVSSNYVSTENKISKSGLESNVQSKNILLSSVDLTETEKENINEELDFDNTFAFMTHSNPFTDSQNVSSEPESCSKISPQVTETVDGLIAKVCENVFSDRCLLDFEKDIETHSSFNYNNKEINVPDSEILVIPETEGLGLNFPKDTEDFLETSTLSESCNQFQEKDNLLNTSSHSRLRTPVVNRIVSALRSSKGVNDSAHEVKFNIQGENETEDVPAAEQKKTVYDASADPASAFHDSLAMDTSFLEDDTQELGNLKQIPYMSEENVQENVGINQCEVKSESNLNFICSLYGRDTEPVVDAEIILFSDVKYAFLQQKTQIHVWRQEKNNKWIKIFCHQIEEMLLLNKMCISKDADNLVVIMLLTNNQQCCLQFLLFERNARVIKLMENTHWLEERHSMDSVLLCGLDGLMFATAHQKESHEVSLHAFIGLKENPRLMTAVLGSTENMLCSLCKIDKLPNALMGVNNSMLYIWHILEARLVTAVSLHPQDYLPIKTCFWATVENGLIYILTTCEGTKEFQVCQLLAANLATGFCQSAMSYSTQPSVYRDRMIKITKATYLEPYLIVAHSKGAFLWSVMEENCCAALSTKSETTTIAISKDIENWGLIAVGYGIGCINCYSLN